MILLRFFLSLSFLFLVYAQTQTIADQYDPFSK